MPHFSQPHAPLLGKFRPEDTLNTNINKYNGHNTNQYTVPYTQQSTDEKQRSLTTLSYPQATSLATTVTAAQSQPPEISQDLCNAILQQQNDAKRGIRHKETTAKN